MKADAAAQGFLRGSFHFPVAGGFDVAAGPLIGGEAAVRAEFLGEAVQVVIFIGSVLTIRSELALHRAPAGLIIGGGADDHPIDRGGVGTLASVIAKGDDITPN